MFLGIELISKRKLSFKITLTIKKRINLLFYLNKILIFFQMSLMNNITSTKKIKTNHILIFILFFLVGASIFLTEKRNLGFPSGGYYTSVHGMALAKNLVENDTPFFMFTSKEINKGKQLYNAYNRFPVFPFYIIGLLTYPFSADTQLQIYISRQIMNLFFFISLIVVFNLVNKILRDEYLSIAVTLLAYSSYFMLSYNNMIFNDIPALLGFAAALYCVVISQKTKLKKRQILFYSLFPIMLGWQAYAVYAAWFIIEGTELLLSKNSLKIRVIKFLKSPSTFILLFAIIGGVLILGLQLYNEWRIVGGEFLKIPSVDSALWRSGINPVAGHTQFTWAFDWLPFLTGVARSIAAALIPFWPIFQIDLGTNASIFIVLIVIIYVIIRYFKEKSSLNKILLILIFSGFFWAIPMRRFVAMHEFQSIFYIGFILAVYILLLSRINLQITKLLAINITLLFFINIALSNHFKAPDSNMNMLIGQFQQITKQLPKGSKVYFDGDRKKAIPNSKYGIDFFMVGNWYATLDESEYVISQNPKFNNKKLTSNSVFNLFKIRD